MSAPYKTVSGAIEKNKAFESVWDWRKRKYKIFPSTKFASRKISPKIDKTVALNVKPFSVGEMARKEYSPSHTAGTIETIKIINMILVEVLMLLSFAKGANVYIFFLKMQTTILGG